MTENFDGGTVLNLGQGFVISGWNRVIQLIPNNGKSFDMRTWGSCDGLELRLDGNTHWLCRGEVQALYAALERIRLHSGEIT